jgi:hypothetical protein
LPLNSLISPPRAIPPSDVGDDASEWDKTDIIHFLSDCRGYRRYLEICTPTTGNLFGRLRQSEFEVCHRLMYRCPGDFNDGQRIDFRASGLDTEDLIAAMRARDQRYDIILVDSFHLYDTSYRDLADALNLLADNGTMVVHDCVPASEDMISAEFRTGWWCGATFIAYVDFVHAMSGLAHATVDTDFGCGIIRRTGSVQAAVPLPNGWEAVRGDAVAAYRFMRAHAGALLNLLSVKDFCRSEMQGAGPPSGIR